MSEQYFVPQEKKSWKHFWSLIAAGCIGGLLALALLPLFLPLFLPEQQPEAPFYFGVQPDMNQFLEHQRTAVVEAVERVAPTVVGITRYVRAPFRPASELTPSGVGSGVIFRSDGYIVTNYHVIENAVAVVVTLGDGTELEAEVVGADPGTDLAVLKVKAEQQLPAAVFGDSDQVVTGEHVIAIGNPGGLQLQQSVSLGIVSATDRSIEVYDWVFSLLQTDAAINPGNSGGPLVNARGEVVGINSVKLLNAEGLGFSIPSNLVMSVIDSLIAHGRVIRPMLGVVVQEITPAVARAYNLPVEDGLYVVDIRPGGPAHQAGIRSGDIIFEIERHSIRSLRDLRMALSRKRVGDEVEVKVFREGEHLSATLILADLAE